jgi:2,3-bisphosphoglycerate-dependent phosphoglycerate mutase
MSYLILVRHGESRWNLSNRFTGWVDVPLSEVGIHEALICGEKLAGLRIDIAFTSKLERAQETLLLILAKQDRTGIFLHEDRKGDKWSLHPHRIEKEDIPIYGHEALNERYYGKLQGLNKSKMMKKYGKETVFLWRRSYDVRPPGGESLKDVYKRVVPYFKKAIMPHVRKGKNVVVSASGNSLRGLIKYLDKISDEDIPHLELPYATPIFYTYRRGKLVRDTHKHSFNRPLHWTRQREHRRKRKP